MGQVVFGAVAKRDGVPSRCKEQVAFGAVAGSEAGVRFSVNPAMKGQETGEKRVKFPVGRLKTRAVCDKHIERILFLREVRAWTRTE